MIGNWNIDVQVGKMPQKVATAFDQLNAMLGASYTAIAYLGSQVVNGTNHAVLAEQTVVTGKDTRNIVLVIFNEKPEGVTLVNIERVVEGGEALGGTQIFEGTEIPAEALIEFNTALGRFVGASVEPFALLATQVTTGTDYTFATVIKSVTGAENAAQRVAVVKVNTLTRHVEFADLLANKNGGALGYAFNW